MITILVADDHIQITAILQKYIEKEGWNCQVVHDGASAVKAVREGSFDLVLLDIMMPQKDGFQVCREIRTFSMVPVIMLTARGEDFEKIMGLDIGADDYIVKPFSSPEVMARIRSLLRRVGSVSPAAGEEKKERLRFGTLEIHADTYQVFLAGQEIFLTKKEFDLLWVLASQKKQVFTREMLLDQLWGYEYYGDSRTVDTHIKRLRSKLDLCQHPEWEIKTVRGVGYRFEENAALK